MVYSPNKYRETEGIKDISVDTLQDVLTNGTKYLGYLIDEDGQLTINKESLMALTRAKIDDLAITQAQSLINTITNLQGNKEALDDLAGAYENLSEAKWLDITATLLSLDLTDDQLASFQNQIKAIQDLAERTKAGLSSGGLGSGSSKSKSTPLDKLLDTSKLFNEQLKDLEKNLKESETEIAYLQNELSKAQTFGDESQIQKYTDLLSKAKNRQISIYKEMNVGLQSLKTQINGAFSEFKNVDLSEYGIAKFRQNIQNQITSLENASAKTDNESMKKNNSLAVQGLNERLSRFNEYASVRQQADDNILRNTQKIQDLETDIYNTRLKETDRISNLELSNLKEIYEKTSDEKTLILGILALRDDENISLEQKIKLQNEYNDALAKEHEQKIKDIEYEESFTPDTDHEKLSETALRKIQESENEIARLKNTKDENGVAYDENSEKIQNERLKILQYQQQYTENQIALAEKAYEKTSDEVALRQRLVDLSNEANISALDRVNILEKIAKLDLDEYERAISDIEHKEAFALKGDYDSAIESSAEKITAAKKAISDLIAKGYEEDSDAIRKLYKDILGYESEVYDSSFTKLDEIYEKTSDEIALRKELVKLSEDENFNLATRELALKRIAELDSGEYQRNIADTAHEKVFIPETDFDAQIGKVKGDIEAAQNEIARLANENFMKTLTRLNSCIKIYSGTSRSRITYLKRNMKV